MKVKKYDNGIEEYTIKKGIYELKVLNIGAVITNYCIDGKNIVLKYKDYNDYLTNTMYLGAIVGRTAGRIKDAKFAEYEIDKNFLGMHNLHGNDLHLRFYNVKKISNGIELSLRDKEDKYPGNMDLVVRYTLTNQGLEQEIIGNSDKPTLMNLTNHSYFNLDMNTSIAELSLQIDADKVWHLDDQSIPKKLIDVKDTAFDYKLSKKIAKNMEIDDEQFKTTIFIDNPYVLKGGVELKNKNNLSLKISTNQKYIVVYTGNYIQDEPYEFANSQKFQHAAICLETQKKPGDINLTKEYYSKTIYNLS